MDRIAYGNDRFQFGDLRLPSTDGPHAVAIVIHGGFWRAKYDLEYMSSVCDALTAAGVATWNVEYRRLGNRGAGFPGTFEDVGSGYDHLHLIAPRLDLDLSRVIAVGHSAGGHLAMWLASQKKLLKGVISLAGVLDLRRAWELQLSNGVVAEFIGGSPAEVPERYEFASPIEQLPFRLPQKVFHGTADDSVPFEISERFVQAAHLHGDDPELIKLEGVGHFELVDPQTDVFARVLKTALALLMVEPRSGVRA
jgi:acetyl esterase/lipase